MAVCPRTLVAIALALPLAWIAPVYTQQDTFDTLMAAYRHREAADMALKAIADLEARGLGATPAAADAIEDLVRVYTRQFWGPDQAEALIDRAIKIREESGDEEKLYTALILKIGVYEMLDLSKHELALADRALTLAQHLYRPDDPRLHVARSWYGMAMYRTDAGLDATIALLKDVAAQQERLGGTPEDQGRTWQTLALTYSTARRFRDAVDAGERGLAFRKKAGDEIAIATSENFLGFQYAEAADYARAREYLDRSIATRVRLLGPDVRSLGVSAAGMAEMYIRVDDLQNAAKWYEQAIELSGPTWRGAAANADYARMLLVDEGDLDRAKPFLDRALALAAQGASTAPALAKIHGNYGAWLQRAGRIAEAKKELDVALDIQERNKLALGISSTLSAQADIAVIEGDLETARTKYGRALASLEEVWADHPNSNNIRAKYATVLAQLNDYERAQDVARAGTDSSLGLVRSALRGLPERQAVQYATALRKNLDLSLALLDRAPDPSTTRQVFERVIRARAIVLDEVARRQHDAKSSPAAKALSEAREHLAQLTVRGSGTVGPEVFATLMAEARAQVDRAEEVVAAASPSFRDGRQDEHVGLDEIESRLPPSATLVAFVRYAGIPTAAKTPERYGAFVLSTGPAVAFVPLGPADAIDAAVTATRAELLREANAGGRGGKRTLASYRAEAGKLRALVWDPIAKKIGSATEALIVPDGSLNLVSFAALPVGEQKYLIESGPMLHYLAAERDVVREYATPGHGLLALGNPRFGGDAPSTTANRSGARETGGCPDLSGLRFSALAGAAREVQSVAALWNSTQSEQASLLNDAAATETAFKTEAAGRRVLHLATHGFFAGADQCAPPDGTRAVAAGVPSVDTGNALLYSGLALAGANHHGASGEAGDDGVLVATEIANLDLSGVEWVVLSACDTGLGSIANGEGVFGLRRAFRIAGASTVIMTLWPVDDAATQTWVTKLYQARLRDHQSTAAAMRTASIGALEARRRANASDHPFYWGGFVAAGDWR